MAERKYFWLRLKEDFFRQKEIKKLRSVAGGDTYTVVYLKLQLLSLQKDGVIEFSGLEDDLADELALELDEQADNVRFVLEFLLKIGWIASEDDKLFTLPQTIQNIGSETAAAERMRKYRAVTSLRHGSAPLQTCSTEIEIEQEIDTEIDLKREIDPERKIDQEPEIDLKREIDPERKIDPKREIGLKRDRNPEPQLERGAEPKPEKPTNSELAGKRTPLPPRGKPPKQAAYEKSFLSCVQALADTALSEDEANKLTDWLQHKRERKDSYTATGFQALLKEYESNLRQYGRGAVFRVVDQSMAAGYAGIVWDRLTQSRPKAAAMPRKPPAASSYDIDEIERMLQNATPRL